MYSNQSDEDEIDEALEEQMRQVLEREPGEGPKDGSDDPEEQRMKRIRDEEEGRKFLLRCPALSYPTQDEGENAQLVVGSPDVAEEVNQLHQEAKKESGEDKRMAVTYSSVATELEELRTRDLRRRGQLAGQCHLGATLSVMARPVQSGMPDVNLPQPSRSPEVPLMRHYGATALDFKTRMQLTNPGQVHHPGGLPPSRLPPLPIRRTDWVPSPKLAWGEDASSGRSRAMTPSGPQPERQAPAREPRCYRPMPAKCSPVNSEIPIGLPTRSAGFRDISQSGGTASLPDQCPSSPDSKEEGQEPRPPPADVKRKRKKVKDRPRAARPRRSGHRVIVVQSINASDEVSPNHLPDPQPESAPANSNSRLESRAELTHRRDTPVTLCHMIRPDSRASVLPTRDVIGPNTYTGCRARSRAALLRRALDRKSAVKPTPAPESPPVTTEEEVPATPEPRPPRPGLKVRFVQSFRRKMSALKQKFCCLTCCM